MKKKSTIRYYGDPKTGPMEITVGSKSSRRWKAVGKWLLDNLVAILALIVAVIALFKQ